MYDKCPICASDMKNGICTVCEFDAATDFFANPTLQSSLDPSLRYREICKKRYSSVTEPKSREQAQSTAVKCSSCGAEWTAPSENVAFCPFCGAKLKADNKLSAEPQKRDHVKDAELLIAIKKGDTAAVSQLLDQGADPNCESVFDDGGRESALYDSIFQWPNDDIAKMLINAGADVNYVVKFDAEVDSVQRIAQIPILIFAISEGNVGMVELLLRSGANPSCERVFDDGRHDSALYGSIRLWPNAQITNLLCSYMDVLPDDIKGARIKRAGLYDQTIKKLKAAGCKVSLF